MDKTRIFETAGRLAAKGQLDKAAKEYQRVLEKDPKDVRALQKLAELHQKNGKFKDAAELLLRVAEGYGEQGFVLKAVAVYKQILKFGDAPRVEVNVRLAQLYQQLGLVGDATQQYQLVANHYDSVGNVRESLAAVRRMVDLDPDNVASRVKLGELYAREQMNAEAVAELKRAASYLKKNDRAEDYLRVLERIAQLAPEDVPVAKELAQVYLPAGDTKRALARLQICFRQNPRDVETLQLLAQAFQALGQTAKTVSVYRELAHVYAESEQEDLQRRTLEKLLELAPEDEEAAEALRKLRGGAEEEPDDEIAVHVDLDPLPEPVAVAPAPSAAPALRPPPTAPQTAQGLSGALPPLPPPSPSLAKLLTETDVYLKYGLVPKAAEHIQKALAEEPDSLLVHERWLTILDRQSKAEQAAEVVVRLVEIARQSGERERERAYLQELGQRAPNHPLITAAAAAADLDEVHEEDYDSIVVDADEDDLAAAELAMEAVLDTETLSGDEEVIALEEEEALVFESGEESEPVEEELVLDDSEEEAFLLDEGIEEEEVVLEEEAPGSSLDDAPVFPVEEADEGSLSFDDGDGFSFEDPAPAEEQLVQEEAPRPEPEFESENFPLPSPSEATLDTLEAERDFSGELDEVEFLLAQDLSDDARFVLEGILAAAPENERALELLRSLQPPEATQPPNVSPVAVPRRDDGFDLAAELADEFDFIDRSPPPPQPAELPGWSMGEVIEDIGGNRPETVEDSQTHYDLGIAYREMGMIDEAIGEFEAALEGRGTRRVVDCLSMIGLCLFDKGEYAAALERYQQALKTPGLTLEASKEAHFHIGLCRELLGDERAALGHFVRVYKADPQFRDVKRKVGLLQRKLKAAPASGHSPSPSTSGANAPLSSTKRGKIGFL